MQMTRGQREFWASRHPVVRWARRAVEYYATGYHRFRVPRACTLPETGPAILVCNHISGLDPCLLQAASPRMITWMMAREYYEMPSLRWFYKLLNAIPVDRGGRDLAATRAALRALQDGQVLGVFPEGRLCAEETLLPFQTGAALLAARTGAPLVPACVEGSMRGLGMVEAFVTPAKVTLLFGEPMCPEPGAADRQGLERMTEDLRERILALRAVAIRCNQ